MKPNGKKTWNDPLVDIANSRKTKAEKKLWGVLRAIARFKARPPKKIIDEIDRVNRKHHLMWRTVPPELERFIAPRELLKIIVDESGRKILYRVDDENPEQWVIVRGEEGKPIEALDEITVETKIPERYRKYFRPHLGSWGPLFLYDYYLFELIPRLRDPDWVAALRICPGCGNLLMSSAKWKNKFCTERCKKRNWARAYRRRSKDRVPENEPGVFICPGNDEPMTLEDCIEKRGLFYACETCKKGGE